MLARVRAALGPAPEIPEVPRAYRQAGALGTGGDPVTVDLFCGRVADYQATVTRVNDEALPAALMAACEQREARRIAVPADAPPLFTVIAQDDRLLYKVVEGLYVDWSNADRPAELHIFAKGAHGFGMVRQGLPADRWIDLFGDWLANLGLA